MKVKPAWNDYLTENDRFKLTEEELLKKKKLYVSKNNIMSPGYEPPRSVLQQRGSKEPSKSYKASSDQKEKETESDEKEEFTSLDLLGRNEQTEQDELHEGEGEGSSHSEESDEEERSYGKKAKVQKSPKMVMKRNKPVLDLRKTRKSVIHRAKTTVNSRIKEASVAPNLPTSLMSKERPQYSTKPTKKISSEKEEEEEEELIPRNELSAMYSEIRSLQEELRMYEEISGKKSALLDADALEILFEEEVPSQKTVMRYLVQLVCQTMTYLLKSEVDQSSLRAQMDLLQAKYEQLSQPQSQSKSTMSPLNSGIKYNVTAPAMPALSTTQMGSRYATIAHHSGALSAPTTPSYNSEALNRLLQPQLPGSPALVSSQASTTPGAAEAGRLEVDDFESRLNSSYAGFTGTSTSDFLLNLMHASPTHSSTIATAPEIPSIAKSSPNNSTLNLKPMIPDLNPSTPSYEYQISPEAAADLAARTFDLYSVNTSAKKATPTFVDNGVAIPIKGVDPNVLTKEGHKSEAQNEKDGDIRDSYENMIERLSYKFTASLTTGDSNSEQASMVVPHRIAPKPQLPSMHPLISAPSPKFSTEKRIYDATLGTYNLVR